MPSLSAILLSKPLPDASVNALAQTVESHIAKKTGIGGMAMKMGFNTLRAARPDIAERATRSLIPDIAVALDPLYAEFEKAPGTDFGSYLGQHAERAAALVMAALDRRLQQSRNTSAKAMYQRFRAAAAGDLQKLLPDFGRVIGRHLT